MPKPRKKRSLTGTEEKHDAAADCPVRLDQDSDTQKSELLASSDSPVSKRAKLGKLKERQHDKYCWNCHFEDCSEECTFCPRVFHMSCLPQIESTAGEWMCPECQAVILAEKNRTNSPVMSLLSTDQLCNLLKYSLQRMEMHVPKDFSFGSSSSVIYPMDLSLLEKNIRKRVYTSPTAFLADAKWIIHNHTVHFPLAVPAIKTIMKVCHEEVREIETCPDCYLHAYSMKDKWFSEPCRKPHTLVWAKLKGFPIWPAKAVKTLNGNVDVRFFGGHERAWVPVTQCYFLSRDPPHPISSQKKNFEFAHQEVELHIKLLTQRFGGFEYAPDKTPFNPSQIYLQLNVTLSKLSYLPQSLRDKRKQEVIPVPPKRRVARAHSAHEVQGTRKDEEKKEVNLDESLIEKEQDPASKENDCQPKPDKTESFPSTEAAESHEEKSVDDDFVTKETTKCIETLAPLLTENISKENDHTEVKVSESSSVSLMSLEVESNSKEESSDISNLQDEDRTEIMESVESTAKETDTIKSCDQQDAVVSLCQHTEKNGDTTDNSNQELSSTICCNQKAIDEDCDVECAKDNTAEVLSGTVNIPVSQQHGRGMSNNQDATTEKELLHDTGKELTMQQIRSDSTELSNKIVDCVGSVHNIETDLKAASKVISSKSISETEDRASTDKRNESKNTDTEYTKDGENAEDSEKPDAEQTVIENSVSPEQSNETQPLTTNAAISSEENSYSCSSPNVEESFVVVNNVEEENKILQKEVNSSTSVSPSNSAVMEISKEVFVTSKTATENNKPNVVDSTITNDKSDVIPKENDMKVITNHNVEIVDPKSQRTTVCQREEQTEDVLKGDNKLSEKTEECHVNDSHSDKNPSTSNSLRIRIVKGKVEPETLFCNFGKESESTQKTILKTEKLPGEESSTRESSKNDLVQSKDGQVKTVTQISEQTSEDTNKQEFVTASTIIKKSKRPRKNIVIQFPRKENQVTHSSSDISSTVTLSEDSETNAENSNHPDEPGIIKDFKATFEKIQKGKYGKSPVVGKIIDYKSQSGHLNETQQIKLSTHLNEAQKVKSVKPSPSVTNFPVIIKVPVSNLSERKTSASDCASSSNVIIQPSQTPCSSTKSLQISGTKSLQIIAIGNRTSCPSTNSTKHPDSSAGPLPKQDLLHYKETEVSNCSNNLNCELMSKKAETSNVKCLNMKDQTGTEVKIQDKCSNTNTLQQNVQVSLKDTSVSAQKESSSTNTRSQGDVQNLNLPFGAKERNLFNILPVEKYARKLTVFLTNTLEEMCQDIINSGCMQVAVHSLEAELENLREKHKKDLADVKQNADLVMKEMRATMETEKQNAVAEVRRQCEVEMRKNVEEAKKKQWCANCGKEAVFYCCWNTSYCDYPCQQSHWPQHMAICGQSHVPSVKEQQMIRTPNLGPDMTITQSPPVLPLEIQLTTPSPTQTNKNKKKPPSSSEKIAIAPRGKSRSLTQSPNASLQPHDISRSSHMMYSPHYRLQSMPYTQGGPVIPVMLPHTTPHQQQCAPNVVMENKSHNVQHTVSFQYNPHACM